MKSEKYNLKIEKFDVSKKNKSIDNIFYSFLQKTFIKKTFNFYLLVIFLNCLSILIKFSLGIYGYSGRSYFFIYYSINNSS